MAVKIKLFLLTSLFISETLFSAVVNSSQLRTFPELSDKKVKHISVIDSTRAVAVIEEKLYKWEGAEWKKFYPQFPFKELFINYVKAFSFKNIWIFTQKNELCYKTDIFHLSKDKWEKFNSPNPYTLSSVNFINLNRFVASGDWGNLICFDGRKAYSLQAPKSRYTAIAKAFSLSSFYLWARAGDYFKDAKSRLYEFKNGRFGIIGKASNEVKLSHFFSPDSGYFITADNILYKYGRNKITLYDSLNDYRNLIWDVYNSNKLIYWHNNFLWEYDLPNRKVSKIARLNFQCSAYCLGKNEFLLKDGNGRLFYLGKKKYGKKFKKPHLKFKYYELGQSPGYSFSLSSYIDRDNKVNLYFTNIRGANLFCDVNFSDHILSYNDLLVKRGLVGYMATQIPREKMDSSVFFSDFDNDGDMDAVCAAFRGKSYIYENCGNDKFYDLTTEEDFELNGRIEIVSLGDLNNDGLIDIVAGDYLGPLHILMNKGFFRFEDIGYKSGVPDSVNYNSTALADIDNDGDLDLFLFGIFNPIRYYENIGVQDSTGYPVFVDISYKSPQLTKPSNFYTQAISFGDYDNDGDMDMFLSNRVSPLKLFNNNGHGVFTDVSRKVKINRSLLAYNANWGDLDQDGYIDLFLAALGKNYILWNHRGQYFEFDSTSLSRNDFSYSTGSIIEDLDQDGDLDIAVANLEIGPNQVYLNILNKKNFVLIKLRGLKSNYFGIGAHIWLYKNNNIGDPKYLAGYRQISTNTGYASSCLPQAYFGVSPDNNYCAVVRFPSGQKIEKFNLTAGSTCIIYEKAGIFRKIWKRFSDLKSVVYRKKYRCVVLRFILFLMILSLFNLYILSRTYWPKSRIAFFCMTLFSAYIILAYLFYSGEMNFRWFIPLYGETVFGLILFKIIQYYTVIQLRTANLNELYDLIRQFHHSKEGIKQIDHLVFYLNNVSNLTDSSNMHKDFVSGIETLFSFTIPMIHRFLSKGTLLGILTENMRRMNKTIIKLQKLQHSILSDPDNPGLQKDILLLIRALKSEIAIVKKEVEKLFLCDPFKVLNDSLGRFPQFKEVSINNLVPQNSLKVVILQDELFQVFTNIFENSLKAMENKQDKRISIYMELLPEGILGISVKDSGRGISAAHQTIIFEESFSTNGSSGLGLFHARKLLRRYSGDIVLLDPGMNKGATFQIKLRIYKS